MKLLCVLLFVSPFFGFALSPPDQGIDIKHYYFQINLNDTTDVIHCTASIKVGFIRPVESFSLDLINKASDGKGMLVKDVTTSNGPLTFSHEKNRLLITLPGRQEAGTFLTIKITYSGIPADGLIIEKNRYGDRTFFGDNWPDRAHHWLPVIDHPTEKAGVDFEVTAPLHYEVIGNGVKVEETFVNEKTKLTHWREETPIPAKVMVIGAARFAIQHAGVIGGIPVEQWVYPQDRTNGFHDYAEAEKMLEFFIHRIGPYPFRKLANVQSKTRYGGMENASNIFYAETTVNGLADHDDLIAHEIAHQWFGNSASEIDWHHVWLSEGFATYFSHLYLEFAYGVDARASNMNKDRQAVIEWHRKNPELPVVFTALPTNLIEILSPNSYEKGSWILHMLRKEVGDENFWEGIRLYYNEHQLSNASTADFQRIMEQVSDQKLDDFFKQWLFTPGHPILNVSWKYNSAGSTVEISINQTQKQAFSFPLEVGLLYKNGEPSGPETLRIKEKSQKFTIKVTKQPSELVLDPHVNLLFEGKITN